MSNWPDWPSAGPPRTVLLDGPGTVVDRARLLEAVRRVPPEATPPSREPGLLPADAILVAVRPDGVTVADREALDEWTVPIANGCSPGTDVTVLTRRQRLVEALELESCATVGVGRTEWGTLFLRGRMTHALLSWTPPT